MGNAQAEQFHPSNGGGHVTHKNWQQLIHIYAITTAILFLKYFLSSIYGANPDNHPGAKKLFVQILINK